MYESPIKIIQRDVEAQLVGDVLHITREAGVVVDKEELLRALRYDREQYEKGWDDAMRSIVRCEECVKAVRHEVFPWSRRCKVEDCRFSHKKTHFCSYGERRTDENSRNPSL